MKVEFNRNLILKTFGELAIGQTFFTSDGDISIKTSHTDKGDNSILYNAVTKCWVTYCEVRDNVVEVVESTLSIDSYERE